MRRSLLFSLLTIAVGTTMAAGPAAAAPPEPPEGFEYVPTSQRIMLGIGCRGEGATCDSVDYWLGTTAGESSVGTTFTVTPLEYLFTALGDPGPYATFFSDDSLDPTYVLRADEPIGGQITVGGYIGGAEVAADSTVEVQLRATKADSFSLVELGSATVNKVVVLPQAAVPSRTYEFQIELDESLDGMEVRNLELVLYVRSVTLLQNGFVNGQGGSWFDLPYYRLVETQAP